MPQLFTSLIFDGHPNLDGQMDGQTSRFSKARIFCDSQDVQIFFILRSDLPTGDRTSGTETGAQGLTTTFVHRNS